MAKSPFPDAPKGEVRVIGPNGTTRSEGEQSPFSNGWMPKGNLGTDSVGLPTRRGKAPTGNRTGEGSGGY